MDQPPLHHVKLVKVSDVGNYPYTLYGVQLMIRHLLDTYGISQFELAKRAGLTPSAIYQILKKKSKRALHRPRRSTVQALARAVGAQVSFDSRSNMVLLHVEEVPKTRTDDTTRFLLQVADAIKQSGRTEIPRDEQDRILRVIRVLL